MDQKVTPLGRRIKIRLDELGMAEREASRQAGFGLSYVGDVIHGRSKEPAMPRIMRLAEVMKCSPAYLMGLEPTAHVPTAAEDPWGIGKRLDRIEAQLAMIEQRLETPKPPA